MRQGFIDIHTHILPGLDDGAADWEQTGEMLRLQREQGVTDIIATPHFDMERNYQDPEQIREVVARANEYAGEEAPGLTVYEGCEVLYTPGITEAYREGRIPTLAGSRYILVEFFPQSSYREIGDAVSFFTREGLAPVIAHVERYQCLMNEYERLYELIKMGAVMQMNSRSLSGNRFDRHVRMCRKMVRKGFIHFLGSDCHNTGDRPPAMREAYRIVGRLCRGETAVALTGGNAANILQGQYL